MPRESQIPLFLWIATAILVHLLWGGGAEHAAEQIEQTVDIGRFARSVRRHVRFTNQTLEVGSLDEVLNQQEEAEPIQPREPEKKKEEQEPKKEAPKPVKTPEAKKPPAPKPPPKKKPEELKKLEEKKLEPEKKPEEKKPEEKKPEKKEEEKKPLVPEPQKVAVRQHVEDKNQKDNPDAQFLGEHANRVKEQTQARITSTEQNDPKPTPGGHHAGPNQNPGNSSESKVAQMEDREGDPDRPPSETSKETNNALPKPVAQMQPRAGAPAQPPNQTKVTPEEGQKAQAAIKAQDEVAPTLNAPGGSFSMSPQQRAVAEQKAQQARQRVIGRQARQDPTQLLGLGAQGLTENGINLNLSPTTAVAVIGQKQLVAERARDGERRRSEHQGSWKDKSFEQYRSSIENYVAGVKPGNQTALNTAQSAFANYLNAIHQRLHPMFAGRFLTSLDRLPSDHPLNDMEMMANLEIVVRPEDGQIVRMGVTKPSGVTAFDIGALDSVRKASPFGAAPSAIVSPDGNVYLHWGFFRNPTFACSTYHARPFMLKAKPKSAPPELPPPAKPREGEEGQRGSLPVIDGAGENGVRTAKAD